MHHRIHVRPRFWVFVIALMLLCFLASFAVAQSRLNQAAERVSALNAQKTELSLQVNSLSSRLDYVRTDAYIERVARDELNMIKPGEVRYVSN